MTSTEELYEQLQILHQDALHKLITFRLDETWKGLSQIEHIITQAEYYATRACVDVFKHHLDEVKQRLAAETSPGNGA
ncbi:hypothetical protein PV375_01095 [Gulosibacter sp. GYB002]|uniref:hypothetical protein n=1 Tax=Gulosibacter sp. GYB002 TaxID=2994391 RepID=UPI002F96DFE6